MNSNHNCPKCSTSMEEGFLVDFTHGSANVQRWSPGLPEGRWFGEVSRQQALEGLKVVTWRCPNCGYLESYARVSHLKDPLV